MIFTIHGFATFPRWPNVVLQAIPAYKHVRVCFEESMFITTVKVVEVS